MYPAEIKVPISMRFITSSINMSASNIITIIPAAGKPTNRVMVNSNLPDAMLPINGKPVIGYIIEDILARGITKAIVILNKNDEYTEKYLTQKFSRKCQLTIVYNSNHDRGIGYSVYSAKKYIKKGEKVLVYLGDTIYKGGLSFDKDFLVVSDAYESPEKWCFIEKSSKGIRFINKPWKYIGNGKVLCGIYFFSDASIFQKILTIAEKKYHIIEMANILNSYAKKRSFKLTVANKWYDCGNIENFHKAKIDFLKVRSFNSIQYDDLRGHITKSSKNIKKIKNEIAWFQNIPDDLKIFTPRLVDYKIRNNSASYTLEFYGYQSLADFFVLGSLNTKLWQIIINKLFRVIELFKAHKGTISKSHYYEMYYKKTELRIAEMKKDHWWKQLLEKDSVIINGTAYKNIDYFMPKFEKVIAHLYKMDEICILHGDLCLSNVLFDPGSRIFKFIDPRGSFGKSSLHGDIKYDLAKLRHSFSGMYDFLTSDLFELKENSPTDFTFTTHAEEYHLDIAKYFDKELIRAGYDLEQVCLIESLLFLSMLPLHVDNPTRQKAMYLTGIRLINESSLL